MVLSQNETYTEKCMSITTCTVQALAEELSGKMLTLAS